MRTIQIGANRTIRLSTTIAMAATLLFATLILFNTSAIERQLNSWKLLPQPERLTELYFEDHAKLSTVYTPGIEQKFSFSVKNLEYRTTEYSYRISQVSEDGMQTQELTSGDFSLNADQKRTTDIVFTPTDMPDASDLGKRVKFEVTLTYKGDVPVTESIHYWSTKIGEGV